VAGAAGIHGRLGHEHRIDLLGQGQHGIELVLRLCVEGAVQATGGRELRQLVLGRERVSHATRFVERVGRRQLRAAAGVEKLKVCHGDFSSGFSFSFSCLGMHSLLQRVCQLRAAEHDSF